MKSKTTCNFQLSHRVNRVSPSATLAIAAKAAALKSHGVDVINLGVGEPDFDTPEPIKAAGITAIQSGFTKYTAVEGSLALRQAVIHKFARDNQLVYESEQILISCGAKQSFFNLTQALLNEGDEVIIPAPYWVSYPDIVMLAGAKPICIPTHIDQQFTITAQQLAAAITPRTRLVILNSPANPTGMAYSTQTLRAFAEILSDYPNILVATDDIYEHIFWRPEPFSNLVMVCPEFVDRTIILHGVSKSYAMTGWRIGFAAGPVAIIKAMTTIQSQSTSNPCSISQMAAQTALLGDQSEVVRMTQSFKKRHDELIPALNKIPGLSCRMGDGTFYAFVEVQEFCQRFGLTDDVACSEFLLEKAQIAIVPGTAFGAPGHIRLSFATSPEQLREAIQRLQQLTRAVKI